MDYDRYDAFLHHIFKQTQGDAWFRPNEDTLSAGVALRINDRPEFRVFPYENIALEPFETAVSALNPVVAVKLRNAAVHAALADVPPTARNVFVDNDTRIQVLETMLQLPSADREQCAAFIRDERVLVVWSESLDTIIPACRDLEDKLIRLLWRSRPGVASSFAASTPPSPSDRTPSRAHFRGTEDDLGKTQEALLEKGSVAGDTEHYETRTRRTWYGKKYTTTVRVKGRAGDLESGAELRPQKLLSPIYNGLAAGLAVVFVGNGIKTILMEYELDGSFMHFVLIVVVPLLFCVSLFFTLQIVQNISMILGPVAHYHENSTYYSAVKPRPNKLVDNALPHITIQMPVYKESLEAVLKPSIESLKRAMQTYARQGGTSSIFVNDDGLRLIGNSDRDERIAYYANHNVGWVARPGHDDSAEGFKRAGRFKKASNMNYALDLSLRTERRLLELQRQAKETPASNPVPSVTQTKRRSSTSSGQSSEARLYGMQYQNQDGADQNMLGGDEDLEEKSLSLAIEEVFVESGNKFRPWAANSKSCRIGEIILLVDSDTIVPEDCLRDAAREMAECPEVAIIQHESDVMQVAHHYFENGVAYFTRRINRSISFSCANGEVAPFVGHNSFLRWRSLQDAALTDPADGKEKIWSESNVSEDFDMALRLQLQGYIVRWASYSNGGFKEGVSLTADDELNRWQKYAYGCSELLFNPFSKWFRRGPINKQIHKFLWSGAPIHYKISVLSYMFSYYGIAASVLISVINYVLLGFEFPVDGFFMHSFEIWLATVVVFFGSGTIGYTLLEYRLGKKSLLGGFVENLVWIPFFFFFFGGLSIPLSQAILAHLFSYNISWGATKKEVERSNFFKEGPKIFRRFWFPMLLSTLLIIGMIVCSTSLVPIQWHVGSDGWAVILPLAISTSCHILFPIVLNPWLMIFSY